LCHKETVELGTYFVRRKKKKKKEKEKKKKKKTLQYLVLFFITAHCYRVMDSAVEVDRDL